MARLARTEMVPETEVGVYHCVQRAVRSAFLCGEDLATGKNFDHRKEWIRARLEHLAGQFGIEVLSFAVMSNHYVILRNRPDVVQGWSDAREPDMAMSDVATFARTWTAGNPRSGERSYCGLLNSRT